MSNQWSSARHNASLAIVPKANECPKILNRYGELPIYKMVADSPGQISLKKAPQQFSS